MSKDFISTNSEVISNLKKNQKDFTNLLLTFIVAVAIFAIYYFGLDQYINPGDPGEAKQT